MARPLFPARTIFEWDAQLCFDGEGFVPSRYGKTHPSVVIVSRCSAPGPPRHNAPPLHMMLKVRIRTALSRH